MRLIGRLPGYDTIVGEVTETTLRVIIEMLDDPRTDELINDLLRNNLTQIKEAVRMRAHEDVVPPGAARPDPAADRQPAVTRRQLPRRHDLAPLIRFRKPVWSATERRLAAALTIEDLRRVARRRTPRAAFDYTDGAADGEVSLARARQAFADVEFHPAVLRDVSTVDTSREVLGRRIGAAVRDRADRVSPG